MVSIRQILDSLDEVAKANKVSQPYIVGGVPRDKYLGRAEQFNDIDITTGDDTVHTLARTFASKFNVQDFKTFNDGHSQLSVDGFKIDFSSNYRAPGIENDMKNVGISLPNNMLAELMSRDFTCNTLLLSVDLKTIKDPTGLAIPDLNKKLIRTCLAPARTLTNDTKRVVRILYLAAKLDFNVDEEIIDWVHSHPETIAQVKPKYLSNKLQESLNLNKEKTIQLLDRMRLWPYVPMLEDLVPYATSSARRM